MLEDGFLDFLSPWEKESHSHRHNDSFMNLPAPAGMRGVMPTRSNTVLTWEVAPLPPACSTRSPVDPPAGRHPQARPWRWSCVTHRRDFREVSPSALRKENHTQSPDPHGHRNPRYGDTPCGTQGCMCKEKDACLSRMYLSYLTPEKPPSKTKSRKTFRFCSTRLEASPRRA